LEDKSTGWEGQRHHIGHSMLPQPNELCQELLLLLFGLRLLLLGELLLEAAQHAFNLELVHVEPVGLLQQKRSQLIAFCLLRRRLRRRRERQLLGRQRSRRQECWLRLGRGLERHGCGEEYGLRLYRDWRLLRRCRREQADKRVLDAGRKGQDRADGERRRKGGDTPA